MNKIKIMVVGPIESGKTVLSNLIADATDSSNKQYNPTKGVRILEFENETIVGSRKTKFDIELWDCSGDFKYDECWPAFAKDTQGVIFVYNPDSGDQGDELEKLYEYFVQQYGLNSNQSVIIVNNKSRDSFDSLSRPPAVMSDLSLIIISSLEDDADILRSGFRSYLKQLLEIVKDKQQQEENNLIIS